MWQGNKREREGRKFVFEDKNLKEKIKKQK